MYSNPNLILVDDAFNEFGCKLTKREKRNLRKQNKKSNTGINLHLKRIEAKTQNQIRTFVEYGKNNHLLLQGLAGTGKTFISIYLAMSEILGNWSDKNKLVIVRSVVPTRDMGFLPGNQKEKQKAYELPYYSIFTELFGRGDAYDYLKNRGSVEFISTSFIRGITLNDSIVLVDECQNLDYGELDSIITRIGNNCRIIFSGDFRQSDLQRYRQDSGLLKFMKILQMVEGFKTINFNEQDIVRSKLVKDYIIAKVENGIFT